MTHASLSVCEAHGHDRSNVPIAWAVLVISVAATFTALPVAGGESDSDNTSARLPAYRDLLHVGIVVPDIEASMREAGTVPSGESPVEVMGYTWAVTGQYLGEHVEFSARFAFVDIGNTEIEFIQPIGGTASPYRDALAQFHDGVAHHLAFRVHSIAEHLAEIRQFYPALSVVLDAKIPEFDVRYVYVDGVIPGILVEFVEMPPTTPP